MTSKGKIVLLLNISYRQELQLAALQEDQRKLRFFIILSWVSTKLCIKYCVENHCKDAFWNCLSWLTLFCPGLFDKYLQALSHFYNPTSRFNNFNQNDPNGKNLVPTTMRLQLSFQGKRNFSSLGFHVRVTAHNMSLP